MMRNCKIKSVRKEHVMTMRWCLPQTAMTLLIFRLSDYVVSSKIFTIQFIHKKSGAISHTMKKEKHEGTGVCLQP